VAEHPARGDETALLVIDMLNPYAHEDADRLAESVRAAVPRISDLIDRARKEDVPVVWVNDNYGDWTSSFISPMSSSSLRGTPGRRIRSRIM
jgi:nicotinamidase-related amidase